MAALCGRLARLWGQWSAPRLDTVGKVCPDVVNSTSWGFRKQAPCSMGLDGRVAGASGQVPREQARFPGKDLLPPDSTLIPDLCQPVGAKVFGFQPP